MYFDEPRESPKAAAAPAAPQTVMGSVLSLNGLALLWFGILPGGLMALCVGAVTGLIPQ
jgi:NADH-quinone oxidoreductase subunit N